MRVLKAQVPLRGPGVVVSGGINRFLAVGFHAGFPVVWFEGTAGDVWEVPVEVALTGDQRPNGEYVGTAQVGDPPFVIHVYADIAAGRRVKQPVTGPT